MSLQRVCDRCGEAADQDRNTSVSTDRGSLDLCAKCEKRLLMFMGGENNVSDYDYERYEVDCPHIPPCGSSCGPLVYKQVRRTL